MAGRVFLARHGVGLQPDRLLGRTDPSLSAEGRRQSQHLAAELAGRGVQAVLSSGLKRSAESAAIVGAGLEAEVRCDPRLDEISYGEWDGLRWADIESRWPQEAASKLESWWGVTPPGGESPNDFRERLEGLWGELVDEVRGGRTLAIVGHLGVNAVLVELAAPDPFDWSRTLTFRQDHGAWRELEPA